MRHPNVAKKLVGELRTRLMLRERGADPRHDARSGCELDARYSGGGLRSPPVRWNERGDHHSLRDHLPWLCDLRTEMERCRVRLVGGVPPVPLILEFEQVARELKTDPD